MPCTQINEDLAALVDGDEDTIARHADHLASCDDCRDARHEATRLARMVAAAGADYTAPEDLAERLLAKVPADTATATATAAATGPAAAAAAAPRARKPVVTASAPPRPRKRYALAFAGIVAAAATLAIIAVKRRSSSTAPASTATAGRVLRVEHAAADNEAGLLVRTAGSPAWRALRTDEPVPVIAQLRTDERTRAWLELADGSHIAIDHRTELTLTPAPRGFALIDGRVVADVTHIDDSPAAITTPAGRIDVLGTRFIVTTTADLTNVRVTRGAVRLTGAKGAPVEVRAGEEGTATATAAATVAATPAAAADTAWASLETDPVDKTTTDAAVSGLGALRAFRPGQSRDKDWALVLANHDLKVRIVGPIARTEITETFRNDTDKVLEGVYQFPLPADARIDSLALDDTKGGFETGAFLDKERAGKIWRGVIEKATPHMRPSPQSDIIWVQGPWRDPALLDWKRGGRFELRVFPIPAKGSRTIKLSYTQVVTPRGARRQYVYPLPHATDGSTAAEKFAVDLVVRGAAAGAVHARGYDLTPAPSSDPGAAGLVYTRTAFVPSGDLVVEYQPDGGDAELRAWTFAGAAAVAPATTDRDKKNVGLDKDVIAAQQAIAADARPTVVIALKPDLPRWRESRPRDYVFVVDSSQSMVGERATRSAALVTAAVAELDRRDRFTVLACDSECASSGELRAPTGTAAADVATWLGDHEAAGASDLVSAVRAGVDRAKTSAADREPWVIFVGDGNATTGFRRAADIEAAIAATTSASGVRVTAMAIGGDADANLLSAVARGGGGSFVAWVPGQRVSTAAMAMIETTHGDALRDPTVELPAGLVDAAPTVLPTIRNGEEILIGARVTGEVQGDVILHGMVGGQHYEQKYPLALTVATGAGNSFVPRLWASLAIDQLERDGRGEDRARIVAMSQGYGVMSRHTSLLVLESQAMFDAFGVDRNQPQVAWTGEDALVEAAADGAVDFDAPDKPGDAAEESAKFGKGQDTSKSFDKGDGGGRGGFGVGHGSIGAGKIGGTGTTTGAGPGVTADSLRDPVAAEPTPPATTRPAPALEPAAQKPAANAKKDAPVARDHKKAPLPDAPTTPPLDRFGRPMIQMRRIWHKIPSVGAFGGISSGGRAAIAKAEDELAANPDSREKHRALVQLLAYAGEVDRAIGIAKRWLERDRLDPQALGYLADLVGRTGNRDAALRLTAGMVDLDADNAALHQRMIGAYDRGGRMAQACAHRIALAAVRTTASKDLGKDAGAAVRCLRALGRDGDATLVLRGLPRDDLRMAAEKAATVAPIDARVAGDLVLNATWSGGEDLDMSIVTPQGARLSWLGGKADLTGADALGRASEKLAVRSLKKGQYLIEIGRIERSSLAAPVRGTIEITALGMRRTLPFELAGDRAVVGKIGVTLEAELVPVTVQPPGRRGRPVR